MDLETLSKSQIILLTLLVSFITSIATGIVTVTLMEQAPPVITQTVNRIVERTVEKVVPTGQVAGAATVTETTIIVKESDLIAQSVKKMTPSIVRLYTTGKDKEGKKIDVFLGLGFVISGDGAIVTDAASLPASGSVTLVLPDGKSASASFVSSDAKSGLALLQGATSTESGAISWGAAALAKEQPTLGEVVVGISGKDSVRIGDGIITTISSQGDSDAEVDFVETNVPAGAIAFGSPLINVDGEVVGISTSGSREKSENTFLASGEIIRYTTKTEPATEEKKP